jgi:hypothetical protein
MGVAGIKDFAFPNQPSMRRALTIISVTTVLAYLVPYALATSTRQHPICFTLSISSSACNNYDRWWDVYTVGGHLAAAVSILLVVITAVIGKWYVWRHSAQAF